MKIKKVLFEKAVEEFSKHKKIYLYDTSYDNELELKKVLKKVFEITNDTSTGDLNDMNLSMYDVMYGHWYIHEIDESEILKNFINDTYEISDNSKDYQLVGDVIESYDQYCESKINIEIPFCILRLLEQYRDILELKQINKKLVITNLKLKGE